MPEPMRRPRERQAHIGDPASVAKKIHVPTYDEILEKIKSRYPRGSRSQSMLDKELARLQTVYNILISKTNFIKDLVRLLDSLHPFFWDLIKIEFDADEIRSAIKCVSRSRKLSSQFWEKYRFILLGAESPRELKRVSAEARGRMLSTIKRCRKSLETLRSLVVFLSKLPAIDPSMETIIIAGAPSTGKSTFISTASRARPRISPYPFTTRNIHVGHTSVSGKKIQLIDTPGLLDRPTEQMNYIERKAVSALKNIPGVILLMIDVSPNPTIDVQNQIKLLYILSNIINKNVYIMLNKIDSASEENLLRARELAREAVENGKAVDIYEGSALSIDSVRRIIEAIAANEGWTRE